MPKNETLMRQLKARYGDEKGETIYWGMAGEGKGPFGPRGKYRAEHEAIAKRAGGPVTEGKKKPRPAGGKQAGARSRRRRKSTGSAPRRS